MVSSKWVCGRLSAKTVTCRSPHPRSTCRPSYLEGGVSCSSQVLAGLVGQNVAEVMLWITDLKKGQFLSHHVKKEAQANLLEREACLWQEHGDCSLPPALLPHMAVRHLGSSSPRWAWLTPCEEMSSPLWARPQTAHPQNHEQII